MVQLLSDSTRDWGLFSMEFRTYCIRASSCIRIINLAACKLRGAVSIEAKDRRSICSNIRCILISPANVCFPDPAFIRIHQERYGSLRRRSPRDLITGVPGLPGVWSILLSINQVPQLGVQRPDQRLGTRNIVRQH